MYIFGYPDALVREAIHHAYNGVCQYCMKEVNSFEKRSYAVDHIIPCERIVRLIRIPGGYNNLLCNYTLACTRCNILKLSDRLKNSRVLELQSRAVSKASEILAFIGDRKGYVEKRAGRFRVLQNKIISSESQTLFAELLKHPRAKYVERTQKWSVRFMHRYCADGKINVLVSRKHKVEFGVWKKHLRRLEGIVFAEDVQYPVHEDFWQWVMASRQTFRLISGSRWGPPSWTNEVYDFVQEGGVTILGEL